MDVKAPQNWDYRIVAYAHGDLLHFETKFDPYMHIGTCLFGPCFPTPMILIPQIALGKIVKALVQI